jgi:hypothetical protein
MSPNTTPCAAEGCAEPAAFRAYKRPAWCHAHIAEILRTADLEPLEPVLKRTSWTLMRCLKCGVATHIRLEYALEKLAIKEPVCRACFWTDWAKDARAMSGQGLTPVDLDEVRALAAAAGLEYIRPLTDPSLPDDPHLTRCLGTCGKISAERVGDMGWGCTCQRNPKRSTPAPTPKDKSANLLHLSDNEAVSWWDHEANDEELWQIAKLRSPKRAAWRCPDHGHTFTEVLREMTRLPRCPQCSEIRDRERDQWLASFEGLTVMDVPELLAAWADPTPPALVPVLDGTHNPGYPGGYQPRGMYNFRCANGHHPKISPISWLERGCQYCRANATRKAARDADVPRLSPEIAAQWHPTRNGGWTATQASPESRRMAWWLDPNCGHQWQQTPRERDKYTRRRCPECDTVLDSLAYHYPELAAEWSPANALTPWHIRPTDDRVVEWLCPEDPAHQWSATPVSRVSGSTCPECQVVGKSRVELDHLAAAREVFGDAVSGRRVRSDDFVRATSWTVDILVSIDGREVAIEYDGSYWHADKADLDTEKSRDLLNAGMAVVRLREHPLPPLKIDDPDYYELVVYSAAPDPKGAMRSIHGILVPRPR